MDETGIAFGPFELLPGQRQLIRDGSPVRLGSRALDILLALTARPGEVVSKEKLIAHVWPDTFVEEANLRVHMVALRKALEDNGASTTYISNVPGRGYCFVAPVTPRGTPAPVPKPAPLTLAPPPALGRIVGREEIVALIGRELPQRRLVSIVGPGGIGKTTVALGVARALGTAYRNGIVFLDLSSITEARFLPGALGAALQNSGRAPASAEDVAAHLREREMLVVLDNCEHLIDAAAGLAEDLLRTAPALNILATSREPLRVAGEWVQRLPSLDVPPVAAALLAREALDYPAVELFVARASECLGGYQLNDADAPVVAELCQRLDGIALAIELAAGRMDVIGLRGIAASLDDRFRLLTRGRRTALPRHQTMRATLDWSYELLPADEQGALRRVAVFCSGFSLAAARAIGGPIAPEMDDAVAGLAAKSLVAVNLTTDQPRYRLLETTRAYGLEKLRETGEDAELSKLHAHYVYALFQRAMQEWETRPTRSWLGAYSGELGNLRAALDWAFSEGGSRELGIALTVAAVPLWFQLSRVDECLTRVRTAMAALEGDSEQTRRWRMQLYVALGWPRMNGMDDVLTGPDAWRAALAIADELGDLDYQLRALWALWVDRTNSAEQHAALELAERYCALAANIGDPADEHIGWRMRARSLHLIGRHEAALGEIERMLDAYQAPTVRSHLVRFQYDQKITARITRGRALWAMGRPEQALADIAANIDDALALGHVPTLCHALSDAACPVALLAGDLDAADRYVEMLRTNTQSSALDVWSTHADGYAAQLALARGATVAGLAQLRAVIERLEKSGFVLYHSAFIGSYALALAQAGRTAEALEAVIPVMTRCLQRGEGWYLPELHRVRGELLRAQGATEPARDAFRAGLDLAARQGALAFELRCATSLADGPDATPETAAVLAGVIARCADGAAGRDLRAARAALGRQLPA